MNTEVWMRRVKVLCQECECWNKFGTKPGSGRCCRNPPEIVGTYDNGSWPITEALDFCFEGIQIEKDLLND